MASQSRVDDPIGADYLSVGSRYEYLPIIDREPVTLPDGNRIALWIGLNVECWKRVALGPVIQPPPIPYEPDPMNQGWLEYGPRVGVWRLMEGFDQLKLKITGIINSDACAIYPRIVEEGNKRHWAWVAHGQNNSRRQGDLQRGEEGDYLRKMAEELELSTGQRPRGWLGPGLSETHETPDILASLGFDYVCDWCNDDLPYPMRVTEGRMISVPYTLELNDIVLCIDKRFSGRQVEDAIKDQFNTLYAEASRSRPRVMCVALHPHLIGQPLYYGPFMRALEYIIGHDQVWATTSDEIATWYYDAIGTTQRQFGTTV